MVLSGELAGQKPTTPFKELLEMTEKPTRYLGNQKDWTPVINSAADENMGRVVYCAGCNRDELIRNMHRLGWRIVAGDPVCPHCDDTPDEWIDWKRQRYELEELEASEINIIFNHG